MKRQMSHLWVLATLLALWLPQRVTATHVDETYNYMVTLNGSNTIRIQVPVYDQDGADCWVAGVPILKSPVRSPKMAALMR